MIHRIKRTDGLDGGAVMRIAQRIAKKERLGALLIDHELSLLDGGDDRLKRVLADLVDTMVDGERVSFGECTSFVDDIVRKEFVRAASRLYSVPEVPISCERHTDTPDTLIVTGGYHFSARWDRKPSGLWEVSGRPALYARTAKEVRTNARTMTQFMQYYAGAHFGGELDEL